MTILNTQTNSIPQSGHDPVWKPQGSRWTGSIDPKATSAIHLFLNSKTYSKFFSNNGVSFRRDTAENHTSISSLWICDTIAKPKPEAHWTIHDLEQSALLILDVMEHLVSENLRLKHVSAADIWFDGARPVFVGLSAIEFQPPGDPTWPSYMEFVSGWLYPAALHKYCGWSLNNIFKAFPNGPSPTDMFHSISMFRKWTQPLFSLVTVPHWLRHRAKKFTGAQYAERFKDAPHQSKTLLKALIKHLRQTALILHK